jgi:ABC-type Fe3+-siderophore transport system permease subunit
VTTSHAAPPDAARRPAAPALAAVWLASASVIALALLSSFRLPAASQPGDLVALNAPRVLFGAGVGALASLAGALRLRTGLERPLQELLLFAGTVGAAAGGFAGTGLVSGAPLLGFTLGAALGGAVGLVLARALERPARWTNFGVALLLTLGIGLAAVAGSYARAGDPRVAGIVTWLLGNLSGASVASGAVLLAAAIALGAAATRGLGAEGQPVAANDGRAVSLVATIAWALSVGAAGPLAFVGSLAPRTVGALAQGASAAAFVATSAAAGAATVVAVDAVTRLLIGGYDFPWNVPAGMLALPIFLGWNRARLRREVGPRRAAFEVLELAVIAALTLAATALAFFFTQVIRSAT